MDGMTPGEDQGRSEEYVEVDLRSRVRAYADVLARSSGMVPDVDVAWKLHEILADEPDAEVNIAEVRRAARRVCARLVASAHLLDVPFTNAPDQSPWTKAKRDMAALYAALGIRIAERPEGS